MGALLGCTWAHIRLCMHAPHAPSPHACTPVPRAWTGSLWDPDITVETLEAHQLQLSFTPWNESTNYQILLSSFPHTENQSCFQYILDLPAVTTFLRLFPNPPLGPEPPP